MADDIEPPSFSLGLDLDLDSDPGLTPPSEPSFRPAKRPSTASNLRTINEEDDDFDSPVKVSAPQVSDPPQALKRLRRGATFEARKTDARCNADDDIEDFSSEEDLPRGNLPTHSVCSSSKSSLHGQKILIPESGSQWKSRRKNEVSSASTSASVKIPSSNVVFPELTVSPIRRFQLIDSDSDDPSTVENSSKETGGVYFSSKNNQSESSKRGLDTKMPSVGKHQTEDLWKDFSSEKSFNIPTPAFDEVCKEFFTSAKNKTNVEINLKDAENGIKWDDSSLPPAHRYFFHKDARIQKLVRDRLPNFFPLGAGNNQGYKQQDASVIDYMGQFNNEDNSRQTNTRHNVEKCSTSKRAVKKSQVNSISKDSENWINPKSFEGLAKDAGKRRVQAASKSAGHWFTGADGRRVYVNQKGQELTGQIAYRHYRKESGVGFKNSKMKSAAKNKTAAKKKSAPKKK